MEEYNVDSVVHGEQAVILGGYSTIVNRLAGEFDDPTALQRIRLDHKVIQIDYSGDAVKVSTESHGTFTARKVICTLPLGYLQAHHQAIFKPTLPPRNKRGISELCMGLLSKIVLRYEEPFWRTDREYFVAFLPVPGMAEPIFVTLFNLERVITGSRALVCYAAAEGAEVLEGLGKDACVALLKDFVKRLFKTAEEPVASLVTGWKQDPWTLGSYSHLRLTSAPSNFDDAASPVFNSGGIPTVFFAGEHTVRDNFATVHGAFMSGERAARELHHSLMENWKL
ncbi:amine oxidase [Zopfochytrium polystomum]|nr:amine oxidase [Zopfochytrium polystomum]